MTLKKAAASLLLGTALTVACNESAEIPKLVPIEAFENEEVVQDVSGAEVSYPSVDILLVIDGSGSMGSYQQNMHSNIDLFIDHLTHAKLDYHIAVTISGKIRSSAFVNAGVYPGRELPDNSGLFHATNSSEPFPYFVTNDTPRGLEILKERIRVGTDHDHIETFFAPVVDAISHSFTSPQNMGFFRDHAYFVPIFVTDSDDQSTEGAAADSLTFFRKLVEFKGTAELVVPYSVHIPASYGSNTPCTRDTSAPFRIEDFLTLAKGTYFDICTDDFGLQLSNLGKDLVGRIASTFSLDAVPDPKTIRVMFGSTVIPNDPVTGWVYMPEVNSVQLGPEIDIPRDENARLRIEFQKANDFVQ